MTPEQWIGQFHGLVLQFPVGLFTLALICDLLNLLGKPTAFKVGNWLIIAGVIMCIPTILTGYAAETGLDPNNFIVARHRMLGYTSAICASLYAGLRISSMFWPLPIKPIHYVWLSILLVALVSWTSDWGAMIGLPIETHDAVTDKPVTL